FNSGYDWNNSVRHRLKQRDRQSFVVRQKQEHIQCTEFCFYLLWRQPSREFHMFRQTCRFKLSLQLTSIRAIADYFKLKWNVAVREFANQRNKIHHAFLLLNNPAHVTDRQWTRWITSSLTQLLQGHWLNTIGNVPRAFTSHATVPNDLLINRFTYADRTI